MNYPEAGIDRINFTVVILNTKVVVAQGGIEIKGVIPIDITPHQPQRVAGFYYHWTNIGIFIPFDI